MGDTSKAQKKFGWRPKVSFNEMMAMMVEHDIYRLKKGLLLYSAVDPKGA